jgi:MoxR-like ATPase
MHHSLILLKKELSKSIIAQESLIEGLLIGLLCEGHILVEGVPGLAKTTTITALSKAIGLENKRIQFTPDLLPSDLIGTEIYNPTTHTFSIKKGPLFTHLLLADEINRAPAKVQSALLEVMQERQITIADESFVLESPFLVMATQNPIEQEGVYPLPEAQLDRFMMKLIVTHNSQEDELLIMRKSATKSFESVTQVLDRQTLFLLQKQIQNIHIDEALEKYIVQLVTATREPALFGLEHIAPHIQYGVSPRASIDLHKACRAKAFLRGNNFVTPVDIAGVLHDVLRHRIILSYEAQAKGIKSDDILSTIIETLPIP